MGMRFDYFVVYSEDPDSGYKATIYSEMVPDDMISLSLHGSKEDALLNESSTLNREIMNIDTKIATYEALTKELAEVAKDLRLRRKALSVHRLPMQDRT